MTNGPPRDELEEFFDNLGELHELRAGVQKKVLAHDIKQAMKAKGISPSEMARRMRTSREAVYRLLDPTRTGVTLDSRQRAASALGLTAEHHLRGAAQALYGAGAQPGRPAEKASRVNYSPVGRRRPALGAAVALPATNASRSPRRTRMELTMRTWGSSPCSHSR